VYDYIAGSLGTQPDLHGYLAIHKSGAKYVIIAGFAGGFLALAPNTGLERPIFRSGGQADVEFAELQRYQLPGQ